MLMSKSNLLCQVLSSLRCFLVIHAFDKCQPAKAPTMNTMPMNNSHNKFNEPTVSLNSSGMVGDGAGASRTTSGSGAAAQKFKKQLERRWRRRVHSYVGFSSERPVGPHGGSIEAPRGMPARCQIGGWSLPGKDCPGERRRPTMHTSPWEGRLPTTILIYVYIY